jgi:hypothetical protein
MNKICDILEDDVDWENESGKRMQWGKESGYWPSHRGGFSLGCGVCVHRDHEERRCKIIPCLVNRVDLFSGCKLKVKEEGK